MHCTYNYSELVPTPSYSVSELTNRPLQDNTRSNHKLGPSILMLALDLWLGLLRRRNDAPLHPTL